MSGKICTTIPVFKPVVGWQCKTECSTVAGGCAQAPASFDPNEKTGPAGHAQARFVKEDGSLPYQVSFENLSSASAPAADVTITDVLDLSLDLSSFRLGEIHFGETTIQIPPGRTSYKTKVDLTATHGVLVDIEAGVRPETREIYWLFRSLDPETGLIPMDPYKGFLPPNDETDRGQGWVNYTIQPKGNLSTGTVIRNKASIVFDYNDPIITNEVFNTIDSGAPVSKASTLDAPRLIVPFDVMVAGADDPGGSGVAQYAIYVSIDGAPYTLWTTTNEFSVPFNGVPGHTYAFYSIATDNVGNSESPPLDSQGQIVPDAVAFALPDVRADLDHDGDVDIDDFELFSACAFGPQVPRATNVLVCRRADFDQDNDVDSSDFAVFQRCYSGEDRLADPACNP